MPMVSGSISCIASCTLVVMILVSADKLKTPLRRLIFLLKSSSSNGTPRTLNPEVILSTARMKVRSKGESIKLVRLTELTQKNANILLILLLHWTWNHNSAVIHVRACDLGIRSIREPHFQIRLLRLFVNGSRPFFTASNTLLVWSQ